MPARTDSGHVLRDLRAASGPTAGSRGSAGRRWEWTTRRPRRLSPGASEVRDARSGL